MCAQRDDAKTTRGKSTGALFNVHIIFLITIEIESERTKSHNEICNIFFTLFSHNIKSFGLDFVVPWTWNLVAFGRFDSLFHPDYCWTFNWMAFARDRFFSPLPSGFASIRNLLRKWKYAREWFCSITVCKSGHRSDSVDWQFQLDVSLSEIFNKVGLKWISWWFCSCTMQILLNLFHLNRKRRFTRRMTLDECLKLKTIVLMMLKH